MTQGSLLRWYCNLLSNEKGIEIEMEFSQKLQKLRTSAMLTQEQLAEKLFVSRVTVSKWESGRGYPNIESLKLLAKVFSLSIDELLSNDELIVIAENQSREASRNIRSLAFGILDFMCALVFILPLFGNQRDMAIVFVALPAFEISYGIKMVLFAVMAATVLFGVAGLALQNCTKPFWIKLTGPFSICLSILGVILFNMTRQPYASSFVFSLLLFKGILLIKRE